MNDILLKYYNDNQSLLETEWENHLSSNDWGSGQDSIPITDEMFWEFVEEYKDSQ